MGQEHTQTGQTYYLDLQSLLTILSRQKRSGHLQANEVRVPKMRGTIRISIFIEHGVLQSCQFLQKDAVVLEKENAYQIAMSLRPIEWQWYPLATPPTQFSPTQPHPPAVQKSRDMPSQTPRAQNRALFQQLSREYRYVLSLCDGTRSLQEIATTLHIPLQVLTSYVNNLERAGFIQFRSSQEPE